MSQMQRGEPGMPPGQSGILLIDKPGGITSHDVVSRVRRLASTRKVGHAGTLDPMATGLLILGVNSATRLLTYLVGLDKEYLATIKLGSSTSTDDADGEVISAAPAAAMLALTETGIAREIAKLTGDISQVPSSYSAIKVAGKRAYALAREGQSLDLAPRPVTVTAFELLSLNLEPGTEADRPDTFGVLDVRVACSSGTYVRALARDLGASLGVGAHLIGLRRTRIGPFALDAASSLDSPTVMDRLLSPADAASRLFPVLALTVEQAVDLAHGKRVAVSTAVGAGRFAAVAPDGRLVGLVEIASSIAKSIVNFPVAA